MMNNWNCSGEILQVTMYQVFVGRNWVLYRKWV